MAEVFYFSEIQPMPQFLRTGPVRPVEAPPAKPDELAVCLQVAGNAFLLMAMALRAASYLATIRAARGVLRLVIGREHHD